MFTVPLGAMCLAAAIVKGACPFLESLNLSNCEIQNRGFGKIIHGFKISKIKSITNLNLRNNFLTYKSLEYFKESMGSGIFRDLAYLDLSDNELGDKGVSVLTRLVINGDLKNIVVINLKRNSISDIGFTVIVKVFRFLKEQKCPFLEKILLEGNQISAKSKNQFGTLPLFYSL